MPDFLPLRAGGVARRLAGWRGLAFTWAGHQRKGECDSQEVSWPTPPAAPLPSKIIVFSREKVSLLSWGLCYLFYHPAFRDGCGRAVGEPGREGRVGHMRTDLSSASGAKSAQQRDKFPWQMMSSPSLEVFKLLQDSREGFLYYRRQLG